MSCRRARVPRPPLDDGQVGFRGAEQLDAHRKRQQAAHAGLTLTGMYNVLEALREGRALTAKEKTLHQQGLVGGVSARSYAPNIHPSQTDEYPT